MNQNIRLSDIVLVSVLPKPKDFEIARVLGWYRIPLKFAPKVIEVDYLAFYQPGTFGEKHRWRIEYFAEMRGHELCRRSELIRDEPNHPRADEEYFKIQLGPLIALDQPIVAERWKRLTFVYTTGSYLLNAKRVEDLVIKSEERELLWKSLRERAALGNRYQAGQTETFPLPLDLFTILAQNSIHENGDVYSDSD